MSDLSEYRMIFNENKTVFSIKYDDIIYIEYIDRNIYIHTNKNEIIKRKIFLKELLCETENTELVRAYRSFVVNIKYIRKITENDIYLYNTEAVIPVSRGYRRKLVKELLENE